MQFISKKEKKMSEDTKAARQKAHSIFVAISKDHSKILLVISYNFNIHSQCLTYLSIKHQKW
jgi:hypothetical protein